jgi:hypothetical protein
MRIFYGWGSVLEDSWPHDKPVKWPPSPEPPGLDELAQQRRIDHYFRVRTIQECKIALAYSGPVLAPFEITDKWHNVPGGRIPQPLSTDR